MNGLDLSTWPVWAVLALTLANIFKDPIKQLAGSFVPTAITEHFQNRAARQADREDFKQEIEEVLVNSRLQNDAAQQLRASWREEQWVEMLLRKDGWLNEYINEKLNRLVSGQDRLIDEASQLRVSTDRTNELLSSIHLELVKRMSGGGRQ